MTKEELEEENATLKKKLDELKIFLRYRIEEVCQSIGSIQCKAEGLRSVYISAFCRCCDCKHWKVDGHRYECELGIVNGCFEKFEHI